MVKRPDFFQIKTYEEFCNYYWYRKEVSQICQQLGLTASGTKQELNDRIKAYFSGEPIKKIRGKTVRSKLVQEISLSSSLLLCGFAFNQTFRTYFAQQTGVESFKFTADMAAAWRKVKAENDVNFTIQDLLDVYAGKSDYAKYDNRSCQWNQFYKDFCADKKTAAIKNKMKVAAILWQAVKASDQAKVYSSQLWHQYPNLLGNE
ncbi:TPA: SAP domain-containing protein [Streptococcus mutans]